MFETLPENDRELLHSFLRMNPLEQLGEILYRNEDGRILQPIRSEEDRRQVLLLMEEYGVDFNMQGEHNLLQMEPFTNVLGEQHSIRSGFDLSLGVHPRFLGNAPHTHDYFEIEYVCQGQISQTIEDRRIDLQTGDLNIICPDVPHDVLALHREDIMLTIRIRRSTFYNTFFGLFSEGDILYEYFHNILHRTGSAPYLCFRTGEDAEIMHLCLEMYRESEQPRDYSSRYRNLLMSEIFLHLLRDFCGALQTADPDTGENAPVAHMLQYISSNCRSVTLADLAERFHYNPTYLSRLLDKTMGRSFLELRAEMRMEKARKLLETTEYAPSQIAEEVGYQNMSHFYKVFRESTGSSPREYRKKFRLYAET